MVLFWNAVPLRSTSQTESPQIAQIGIAIPNLRRPKTYSKEALDEIRDVLHADYVRTGWLPNGLKLDKHPWQVVDRDMRNLCASGLKAMILTPSPNDDSQGWTHLIDNIDAFFARYTAREPGCIRYAEAANEADLPKNGFKDVEEYAAYYEAVAKIVSRYGISVITSGTSGKDLPWTYALATLLHQTEPAPPVTGFGFHPYGVAPGDMTAAVMEMRRAAAAGTSPLPEVYVTEMGDPDPEKLYRSIVSLARVTPVLTIFEYVSQGRDEEQFALKEHPALFKAVTRAWHTLHEQ